MLEKKGIEQIKDEIKRLYQNTRRFCLRDVLLIADNDFIIKSYSAKKKKSICIKAISELIKDGVIISDGEVEFGYIIKDPSKKYFATTRKQEKIEEEIQH